MNFITDIFPLNTSDRKRATLEFNVNCVVSQGILIFLFRRLCMFNWSMVDLL